MTQIKRLSLNQNGNEKDSWYSSIHLVTYGFKQNYPPRAFDFEGETSMACDEIDGDNDRKWGGEKEVLER